MVTITYKLAHAAAWDAANANARKNGRTVWNEDDYAVACDVMQRLLGPEYVG